MIVDGKRALAYTVIVDAVDAIEGADNIALATVGGWKVIVKKEEFAPGDVAVFFEIDSKLPEINRYEFMARKHYKVKTMKLGKFNVVSQGLLMPLSEFPELGVPDKTDGGVIKVGYDLTDVLHITYAEAEDNKRKLLRSIIITVCDSIYAILIFFLLNNKYLYICTLNDRN